MHYPSWRYSATGEEPRVIHSPEQEEDGWEHSPACHGIETAPGLEPDPEIAGIAKPDSAPVAANPAGKRKRRA